MNISVNQASSRDRSKLILTSTIRKDVKIVGLNGDLALDRVKWQKIIHIIDLK